jgi:tetratricopeptide (TPR) repeat protein
MARSARQLYWSHITLGDVFGSPARFSLGRTSEAVEHYRKASLIAEKLLKADPGNDVAKLDLARALSREGVALATSRPSLSLELLQRSHSLAKETSPQNHSGLISRFDYLTSSVEPLVQLGELLKAREHSAEAKAALKQIQEVGMEANERSLLRAEAIQLYASGQAREALAEAERHLALLPSKTSPVLSENFEMVQLLERIRTYAAGLDETSCASATDRLLKIWGDLRVTHPRSAFVLSQAERAQSLDRKGCASKLQAPTQRSVAQR